MIEIQDPETGQIYEIEGDKIPSADQLKNIYSSLRAQNQSVQPIQQPQQNPLQSIPQAALDVSKAGAQTLMPDVINYVQNKLQQIGQVQGQKIDLTPKKSLGQAVGETVNNIPQIAQSSLASAMGPWGMKTFGVDEEQKQAGRAQEQIANTIATVLGLGKLGSSAVEGVNLVVKNKTINPFKIMGNVAQEKATENLTKIPSEQVVEAAKKAAQKMPTAYYDDSVKYVENVANKFSGNNSVSISDLLNTKIGEGGVGYSARSGAAVRGQDAAWSRLFGSELNKILRSTAPEVKSVEDVASFGHQTVAPLVKYLSKIAPWLFIGSRVGGL